MGRARPDGKNKGGKWRKGRKGRIGERGGKHGGKDIRRLATWVDSQFKEGWESCRREWRKGICRLARVGGTSLANNT